MQADDAKSKPALGFLTVVEHQEHGLFGGYLVLNTAGRPLEFHCTAPIKANRAQKILFGPTLESYLFGEQIGLTLLKKATTDTAIVCTDCLPALAVRSFVRVPVALVLASLDGQPHGNPSEKEPDSAAGHSTDTRTSAPEKRWRLDAAHQAGPRVTEFQLGPHRLAVPVSSADDRELITERLRGVSDSLDLIEPFGRIREAIDEARRGG